MKRAVVFSLTCLAMMAFSTQINAGFRVRPASDNPMREPRENPRGEGNAGENRSQQIVHHMMHRFDKDRDGNISFREAPQWLRNRFGKVDTNKDGQLDPRELMEMLGHKPEDGERPEHPPKHHPPRNNTPRPLY